MNYRWTGYPTWPQSWLLPLSHRRCMTWVYWMCVQHAWNPFICSEEEHSHDQMSSPLTDTDYICSSRLLHKFCSQKNRITLHNKDKRNALSPSWASSEPGWEEGHKARLDNMHWPDQNEFVKPCHCTGLNGELCSPRVQSLAEQSSTSTETYLQYILTVCSF